MCGRIRVCPGSDRGPIQRHLGRTLAAHPNRFCPHEAPPLWNFLCYSASGCWPARWLQASKLCPRPVDGVSRLLAKSRIVAVTGLAFETRIASGPGVFVVCGGDRHRFADELTRAVSAGCRGIVSFGIAGGLSSALRPGALVVASEVIADGQRIATTPRWSQAILRSHPDAIHAPIAGSDALVTLSSAKFALGANTDAVAVDMESHIAARVAAAHELPFVAIRAVADPVHRTLPEAALGAVSDGGYTNVRAVVRSLAREPRQFVGLMRLGLDARRAQSALRDSRRLLGEFFGLPELGEAVVAHTAQVGHSVSLPAPA
jgi:adenosylhomocysteine nucleosidase